jgi:hypothetical protein
MYKVTIEETVGEISKRTILETDDVELVKEVLGAKNVVEVDSDEPNRNISPEWQKLQDWMNKQLEERKTSPYPFGSPYETPSQPWIKPYDPYNPFVVTC